MFMKKIVSTIMIFVMSLTLILSTANAAGVETADAIQYTKEVVVINGVEYTPEEFDNLLNQAVEIEAKQPTEKSALAASGIYFIPGIGQVLVTATGAIILGGVTIAAGSWIGKKIVSWFKQQKIIRAVKNKIPSRLKDGRGNVDLGKFKQKVRGKNAYKESGGWMIERDYAGHGGRKWKLKDKSGKRIGSLDGNGKVLGE